MSSHYGVSGCQVDAMLTRAGRACRGRPHRIGSRNADSMEAALQADQLQVRTVGRLRGWRAERLDVGDAEAGVGLVAAVDRYQVGGEGLDLAAVAEAAGVDAAGAGDTGGQGLDQVGRLPVVA